MLFLLKKKQLYVGKCSWAPPISHIHKRFAISNVFFTNLFADDTSFLKSNIKTLVINANFELKKAAAWLQANRLTLNVS